MDKYIVAPPNGSTNNGIGASDRKWKEGHFETLPNWQEYLAESTGYGIVSGCEPTISGLTVTVAAGIVHLADGTRKELSATNITLDAADSTNPRIDLVYIDSTGTVAKITGTASASPVVPSVPSGGISIAQVNVAAGASNGILTAKTDNKRFLKYVMNERDNIPEDRLENYSTAYQGFMAQKAIDEEEGTLTVATYNIANANSFRRINEKALLLSSRMQTVILMTKAQFIGMNEINTEVSAPYYNLYNPNGVYQDYHFYAPLKNIGYDGTYAEIRYAGKSQGNAIMSTYEISDKSYGVYSVPSSGNEKRGYTHGKITVDGKVISIYSTHLSLTGEERATEVTELVSILDADTSTYKIVMGDLNFVTKNSQVVSPLIQRGYKFVNYGKYKTFNKTSEIDEIIVSSNIDVLSSGYIEDTDVSSFLHGTTNKSISDHSPLFARLKFN